MPTWSEYAEGARSRGVLGFALFAVETVMVATPDNIDDVRSRHLAYQGELESAGHLFLAGPLSDESGTQANGAGLIIYRAASLEDARLLAENDPMHKEGVRCFTIRAWLVNEGSLSFTLSLSNQRVTVR